MANRVEVVRVVREVRAWDLGGTDWTGEKNERVRRKGGRAIYEECTAFGNRSGKDVRLGRVDSTPAGLKPVVQWVDGDDRLEVVEVREVAAPAKLALELSVTDAEDLHALLGRALECAYCSEDVAAVDERLRAVRARVEKLVHDAGPQP